MIYTSRETTRLQWQKVWDYVVQHFTAQGFQLKGKLLIRRSGVMVTALYPDRSCPSLPDIWVDSSTIWNCPLKWELFREGNTKFSYLCHLLIKGEPASPALPIRETGKYPTELFKRYVFNAPFGSVPIVWDEYWDLLDRPLLRCFHCKRGRFLV